MQFLSQPRSFFANKTFEWMPSDAEEHYEKIKHLVPYGPKDITYAYNNRGFRCDDFDSWEKYPYRILFAGCSHTEGIGLPIQDIWAKVLHKMICEEIGMSIPYWNIGIGGTGIDHMVRYLYHEGDTLRPQIIISLLPGAARRERWNGDFWGPWCADKKSAVFLSEPLMKYQTEKNFVIMQMLLERWNSYLLYDQHETTFDLSYIEFPRIVRDNFYMNVIDYARDYNHWGPKSNKRYADMVFAKRWEFIKEKIGLTKPN